MLNYTNFVHFVCDLLVIDEPNIIFLKGDKVYNQRYQPTICNFPLKESAAATSFPRSRTIVVDLDKHSDDLEYVTIAHEIRHLFQYEAVNAPDPDEYDEKKVIRQWKKDLRSYKDSSVADYENQAIEVDATAFAYYIIKLVFNRTISFKCDTNKLIERYAEIKASIPTEEIQDCAKYCGIVLKG